jgi:DNA-binding NarL/FixJ family response regulator
MHGLVDEETAGPPDLRVVGAGPSASAQVQVGVIALDPMLSVGAASVLRSCPAITVVGTAELARVVVIIVDAVADQALDLLRAQRDQSGRPEAVLVAADFAPAEALLAMAEGARGLVRRREADAASLGRAVLAAAAGDCTVPPDLLVSLLEHDAPHGSRFPRPGPGWGLTEREHAVLSLIAEGRETDEIARELCYSPRTVVSIVHDVTRRFRLRNRSHAVAYALRAGLL